MSIFIKAYIITSSIIGTIIFLLFLIGFVGSAIKFITFSFSNKKIEEKLGESNMVQDIFGKMTDEERKELESTGKCESKLDLNLDTLKVTKETK